LRATLSRMPTSDPDLADDRAHSTGDPAGRTPSTGGAVRVALALVSAAVVVLMLHSIDTPWVDLGRHLAYVVLTLTLPGTIVHKALRGSVGSWLGDLGFGTTVGLVLELAAWMVASLLDVRGLLWLWPLAVLPLLAIAPVRRRVLSRPSDPWPTLPLLGVTASAFLGFWLMFRNYAQAINPLPPTSVEIYKDLFWHMGLSAEAERAFPLQTPQVIGDGPLHYHWFSNAHVAAATMITKSEATIVWMRLWWVPLIFLGVLLVGELARRVTGSAWTAAGSALLASSTFGWPFWPDVVPNFGNISALSPSQLFSVPLSLLTVHALVELLRNGRGPAYGTFAVAVLGMLGCAGAKASTLPLIVGGLGVAFLASLVLRRQRLVLLGLGTVAFFLMAVGQLYVSGGGSGQAPMLGHALTRLRPYQILVGTRVDYDLRVADGLWNAPGVGKILLPGLLLAMGLAIVRVLSFVLPLLLTRLRQDLAAWLLSGVCLAACLVFMTLAHNGFSQVYFIYGATPFGSVLWAWGLREILRGHRGRQLVAMGTTAVVTVAVTWGYFSAQGDAATSDRGVMLTSLRAFVVQACVLLGVLTVLTIVSVVGRRHLLLNALRPVAVVALVVPFAVGGVVHTVHSGLNPPGPPAYNGDRLDESRAGVWIEANVPEFAVMATNIHCLRGTSSRCDSRKWWISGLGGRRVLIESWNYTPRGAVGGYYDLPLLRLNQEVFWRPTAENVQRLADLGVTWLVADTQPGNTPPSRSLATFATPRYSNDTITVYELTR